MLKVIAIGCFAAAAFLHFDANAATQEEIWTQVCSDKNPAIIQHIKQHPKLWSWRNKSQEQNDAVMAAREEYVAGCVPFMIKWMADGKGQEPIVDGEYSYVDPGYRGMMEYAKTADPVLTAKLKAIENGKKIAAEAIRLEQQYKQ